MSLGIAPAGRPKWSSNQKDLHWPVANEPAVFDVTDLILRMNRRSCIARRKDNHHPKLGQAICNVSPSTCSMMANIVSSHRTERINRGARIPSLCAASTASSASSAEAGS
ncbi:hypothetical protein JDV02_004591 [Purpureocillium takamizusanense]|uniref:Uncharacterized protein n=1 Tax=Purpureocillium takamizusanense TaxID=2060973 RepID=A0A9Q8VB04_9HYPO|nr:uncharacterized protein JDV02_004591 [Purpureocillium takamizusanense]UNI18317.1 hypothetical protein JDV02_004591 [Purpureocillium takamizusanense]